MRCTICGEYIYKIGIRCTIYGAVGTVSHEMYFYKVRHKMYYPVGYGRLRYGTLRYGKA